MAQSTKNINKKRTHLVKEKHNHVFLFIFLALIVAAAVVYGVLIFKPRDTKPTEDKQDNTSKTEQKDDKKDNQKSAENDKKTEENEPKPESEKNNPQYEGNNPNSYDDLTGIINASIIDGNVDIRVAIDQSVSGACVFTITTPSGKIITGSGALEIGPSSSFCSFTTSSTESGIWKISVAATSSDKRGIITSEVNL